MICNPIPWTFHMLKEPCPTHLRWSPLASVFHPLNASLDPVAGVEAYDRVLVAVGVQCWYGVHTCTVGLM